MNRKFLDGLFVGVEIDDTKKKEIIDSIMSENGKQIEAHKTEVATIKNDLKVQENLVEELNKKIKESSELDIEALKQEQFDLGKAEGKKEVETFKKNIALEKALGTFKAKDIKLLSKLIDNEKIKYEEKDGDYNISGLEEQVKEIKKSHEYLFEEEKEPKQPQPRINTGEQHQANPTNEPTTLVGALREKFGK